VSAPIIWLGTPVICAILLWVFRKKERETIIAGIVTSFILTLSAVVIPVGRPLVEIGSFIIQIESKQVILGRNFSLTSEELFFAGLIYLILFIFLSMSIIVEIPEKFLSLGFLLTCVILAALSVQPFLYAALLLEIGVILSIIILCPKGELPTTGVLRFLIFQSLGMPFMLAAGWALSAVEANPTESILILQALGLIGLGFAFWLAVFPFNFWMPQLAEEKPAFLVGFVFLLFNTATLLLIMRYLDGFVWLRDDARIFVMLRLLGLLMVLSSSIFFLVSKNMYRSLAYLISFETGLALLAMSVNEISGWNLFALMFLPRIIAFSIWAAAMTFLQQTQVFENNLKPLIHPYVFFAIALSGFSISGLPLLPGFTSSVKIIELVGKIDTQSMVLLTIASVIFILAIFFFIFNLLQKFILRKESLHSRIEKVYFIASLAILGIFGTFPQFLLSGFLKLLDAFPNLK
jgi:formate hydrogenlyase subunit 3/multisubunit Na+/H+ antiporter MnhD subunit